MIKQKSNHTLFMNDLYHTFYFYIKSIRVFFKNVLWLPDYFNLSIQISTEHSGDASL